MYVPHLHCFNFTTLFSSEKIFEKFVLDFSLILECNHGMKINNNNNKK